MLSLPSLELARAMRRHQPLLSCRTSNVEVAAAAIQAATVERQPILISLDGTVPGTLPPATLLNSVLELGRDSKGHVSVEVIIPASKEAASWWLERGVLAVTLSGDSPDIGRVIKAVAAEARAHGAEVGVELPGLLTAPEAAKLREWPIQFCRLALPDQVSTATDLVQAIALPVIAALLPDQPRKVKELRKTGCAGITLSEELHESFTGGVRTGIRSRTVIEPAKYLGYGATAVRELVRTHYNYFITS